MLESEATAAQDTDSFKVAPVLFLRSDVMCVTVETATDIFCPAKANPFRQMRMIYEHVLCQHRGGLFIAVCLFECMQ